MIKLTYNDVKKALAQGLLSPLNSLKTRVDEAKRMVKFMGVKGFKKLRLKQEGYHIGRQNERLEQHIAFALISLFEELGFQISQKHICCELAERDMLDTLTIYPNW